MSHFQCVEGGELWSVGSKVLLKMEFRGVLQDLYQMWGNWNLPRSLLRDRSLTLITIASLIILAVLCASLSSIEKMSTLMLCPEVLP